VADQLTVNSAPGKPALLLGAFDIASLGYVAEEFFISGTASSYSSAAELGPDGRWSVTPSGAADFTTRMVVLTPADRAQFNGTVLVEWLNVSGGIDAPAVWMMAHREIVRAGYAYVAVSAQRVGVEGGVNIMDIDMSLKSQDPTRYAALHHPGDAYSYDIFSQAGRIVRDGQGNSVLRELGVEHVVAVGESQSTHSLKSMTASWCIRGSGPQRHWTAVRYSTCWRAAHPKGSHFVLSFVFRSSPSSPKRICSAALDGAITVRDSLITNGFGSGRLRVRRMPITTRFK
jgi:Alpha/beta hydrolase domain